jgi:predicted secreted Zn-dependent protease
MVSKDHSQKVLTWRKASRCMAGECVEVAKLDGMIVFRNSKRPNGRLLAYTADEWQAFVEGIKAGEFDDLQ